MPLIEPFIILTALLCGMASRAVGFPALIGYLTAGFVLYEFDMSSGPLLAVLADLGITLLLFTIGLKLEPTKLLETKVLGHYTDSNGGHTGRYVFIASISKRRPAGVKS